jgi:hypothetical protein
LTNSFSHNHCFAVSLQRDAPAGLLEVLVNLLQVRQPLDLEGEAFWCLGTLCYNNPEIAHRVGRMHEFVPLIQTRLLDSRTPGSLKVQAIFPCQNVASYSWESHFRILNLVPSLVSLLDDFGSEKMVAAESVIVINNVSLTCFVFFCFCFLLLFFSFVCSKKQSKGK